jgi:hypothetical protein
MEPAFPKLTAALAEREAAGVSTEPFRTVSQKFVPDFKGGKR